MQRVEVRPPSTASVDSEPMRPKAVASRERGRLAWGIVVVTVALAELGVALLGPLAGLGLHLGVLVALLLASLAAAPGMRPLLGALLLVPLVRIVSLTVPVMAGGVLAWYALTSLALVAGALAFERAFSLRGWTVRLPLRNLPTQLAVMLVGLPLALAEVLVGPTVSAPMPQSLPVLAAGLVALMFAGCVLEIVFRGILQATAVTRLGQAGIPFASALFAVLALPQLDVGLVLLRLVEGLALGIIVARTGSIVGVCLGRGLANILVVLILPLYVAGARVGPSPTDPRAAGSETLPAGPIQTAIPRVTAAAPAQPTLAVVLAAPPTAAASVPATAVPTPAPTQPSAQATAPALVQATATPQPAGDATVAATPPLITGQESAQPTPSAPATQPPLLAAQPPAVPPTEGVPLAAPPPTPDTTLGEMAAGGASAADQAIPGQASPEQAEAPSDQPAEAPSGIWTYIVQPGDSLFSIAREHGQTLADLLSLNPLPNPDLIYPGQEIRVGREADDQ